MPENLNTTEEFNLDAWLDGAKRTERAVTLYARADLLADIDKLKAQMRALAPTPEDDDSYASDGPAADLQAKIDALYIQMDASKIELRVSTLIDEEINTIEAEVKKDLKAEADAAAAAAREDAKVQCRRAEVTAVNDINSIVRQAATAAAQNVFTRETNIRTITAAVVSPKMTADQVRKLYRVLGDKQVGLISAAYSQASNEAPQVAVPKSLRPSQNDDGATSS